MDKCGEKCEVYSRVTGYFRPVANWNQGKREEFRERKAFHLPAAGRLTAALAVVAVLFALSGCAHNTGAFTIGTRVSAGLDPQNATANLSYTDGLNIIDVSRENSGWEVEIDADNGVAVDPASGTVTGVKKLRREVGPQITGYLVELAEKHPEMAGSYVEAVKYYWKFRAQGKAEPGAGAN